MPDKLPFRFRSREGHVSSSIAEEARDIVWEAAKPVPPGATVKRQMRQAARALGYSDGHWRIRAAWNGEADSWSAKALEELRGKYRDWADRQARRATDDKRRLAALYAALAVKLEATDPHFHRTDIASLVDMARHLGGLDDGVER
jgi:hypothetical protein